MTEMYREKRTSRSNLTDLMIFKNRWWQHLLFWSVALLILLNIFKSSGKIEKIDVIYTFIFMAPILGIVYLNLYLAVPRLLRKERYPGYVLIFLILTGGGALFLYLLFDRWIDLVLPGYYFISYYNVPVLMIYAGSFLLLTTLLKLSRSWFMLLRLERMTSTYQLQSLQSQINPHFLLNSLQTIYALSLEKSERTPGVILRLSEILKYTLYETESPRIPLEKEIRMVTDYVEMYRLRVDPVRADIRLETEGDPGDRSIAPMLLIPFIENAFKHGLQGRPGGAYVHIRLAVTGTALEFSVVNNAGSPDVAGPDMRKGIGIENTRQRLDLLYPGRHRLRIRKEADSFHVSLELQLTP